MALREKEKRLISDCYDESHIEFVLNSITTFLLCLLVHIREREREGWTKKNQLNICKEWRQRWFMIDFMRTRRLRKTVTVAHIETITINGCIVNRLHWASNISMLNLSLFSSLIPLFQFKAALRDSWDARLDLRIVDKSTNNAHLFAALNSIRNISHREKIYVWRALSVAVAMWQMALSFTCMSTACRCQTMKCRYVWQQKIKRI